MNKTLSVCLAACAIVGFMGIGPASADTGMAIIARQACMKANVSGMKVMVPMVKGEMPYDGAAVQKSLGNMEAACADWANFWPVDSMATTPTMHRSAPAIWSDPEGFKAASASYFTAFTTLKASKDEAGFKAAFGDLGKGCGGCHEKFRSPE
jgi:cytochrome c556